MTSSFVFLKHRLFAWIGIVTAGFFTFCAVASWYSGQGSVSPFFLIFVGMGLYVWLTAGETEISDVHVRHRSYLATHSIRWDEVAAVEFDPQGQAVRLRGRDKQLVIPGIASWPQNQRALALQLLKTHIQQRAIETRENPWIVYQWSKNTREKR
jgi:hypothetical protein